MESNERALQLLGLFSAIRTCGHYVYKSGNHGKVYVNKDDVSPHVYALSDFTDPIAEEWLEKGIEVVVAPAVGALGLGQMLALSLCSMLGGSHILSLYAEKELLPVEDPTGQGRKLLLDTGKFVLKRGYAEKVRGRRVLVFEDILTSGQSARATCEAVRLAGGIVCGVAALCNRGGVTAEILGVPRLTSLVEVSLEQWSPQECPLCRDGVPVNTDLGKGAQFLASLDNN